MLRCEETLVSSQRIALQDRPNDRAHSGVEYTIQSSSGYKCYINHCNSPLWDHHKVFGVTMKVLNFVHAGALTLALTPLAAIAALPAFPTVLTAWCRHLPGDDGWPTTSQWEKLNSTVGGRLIKTYPLGSICHDPVYDAEKCASLQAQWIDPQLQ